MTEEDEREKSNTAIADSILAARTFDMQNVYRQGFYPHHWYWGQGARNISALVKGGLLSPAIAICAEVLHYCDLRDPSQTITRYYSKLKMVVSKNYIGKNLKRPYSSSVKSRPVTKAWGSHASGRMTSAMAVREFASPSLTVTSAMSLTKVSFESIAVL